MMSSKDCTRRAAECLMAAKSCSEQSGQADWQRLADLWTTWGKLIARLADRERLAEFPNPWATFRTIAPGQ